MKWFKNFLLFLTILMLSACVTTGSKHIDVNDPDYQQGAELGKQTADGDKGRINCANGAMALRWAKKRMDEPAMESRSEMFRSGFYRGYVDAWDQNMGAICE